MTAPPPDYTEQLKAIVAALNHPTTPSWLIAALSAILGLVSGIFVQTFSRMTNERIQRNRMRKALYTDLGGYFMFIYSTLANQGYSRDQQVVWQQEQFERRIKFSVEDFLKKQPEVYMTLLEYRAAEELYLWLHHTVDKTQTHCSNPDMFCQIFSEYVETGALAEKYFEKYGGKEHTAKLMAKVRESRELIEKVKKLAASGHIKVVDGFLEDQ